MHIVGSRKNAFTLVEVLVAMVVFSVLLYMVYVIFSNNRENKSIKGVKKWVEFGRFVANVKKDLLMAVSVDWNSKNKILILKRGDGKEVDYIFRKDEIIRKSTNKMKIKLALKKIDFEIKKQAKELKNLNGGKYKIISAIIVKTTLIIDKREIVFYTRPYYMNMKLSDFWRD